MKKKNRKQTKRKSNEVKKVEQKSRIIVDNRKTKT